MISMFFKVSIVRVVIFSSCYDSHMQLYEWPNFLLLSAAYDNNQESNFSWDFLYKYIDPRDEVRATRKWNQISNMTNSLQKLACRD